MCDKIKFYVDEDENVTENYIISQKNEDEIIQVQGGFSNDNLTATAFIKNVYIFT
jgi:hypothetical protein